MTPTARSLALLRQLGYLADVCERWLPEPGLKRDLFGVADIAACHPRDRLWLLVQATSYAHVADRLRRVQARPELPLLLKAGLAVEVWGWRRTALGRWVVRRVPAQPAATLPHQPRSRRPQQREMFA